eukprot:COSAG01_NODE_582_length_15201_cov_7.218315_23_plen_149_part_00
MPAVDQRPPVVDGTHRVPTQLTQLTPTSPQSPRCSGLRLRLREDGSLAPLLLDGGAQEAAARAKAAAWGQVPAPPPELGELLGELGQPLAVSHFCACIGSPCLRQCVHGAPIGGGSGPGAQPEPAAAASFDGPRPKRRRLPEAEAAAG